jgi:hypothetical protein
VVAKDKPDFSNTLKQRLNSMLRPENFIWLLLFVLWELVGSNRLCASKEFGQAPVSVVQKFQLAIIKIRHKRPVPWHLP